MQAALNEAENSGIATVRALRVLLHLARHDEPQRFKDVLLALWGTHVTGRAAALTRQADALTRAGLLKRYRCQGDRRSCLLALTPAGASLAAQIETDLPPEELSSKNRPQQ